MTTHHNHATRDIKPRGQCPACDLYWDQVKPTMPRETTKDAAEMAKVIMLSCATRMNPETALHYGENLVKAGYGKLPIPPARESDEWEALVKAAEDLGEAAAKFQNTRDAFINQYPKDKQ